jgi:lysophospholipase L1-like esterase
MAYKTWYWVGDSRTVGMDDAVTNSLGKAVKSTAQVGAGHAFLVANLDKITSATKDNIVFNLGINDILNTSQYRKTYTSLLTDAKYTTWRNSNRIYFLSINPVTERYNGISKETWNNNIKKFNTMLKDLAKKYKTYATYIDTNTLMQKGTISMKSSDGIHYNNDTYVQIYRTVTGAVSTVGSSTSITEPIIGPQLPGETAVVTTNTSGVYGPQEYTPDLRIDVDVPTLTDEELAEYNAAVKESIDIMLTKDKASMRPMKETPRFFGAPTKFLEATDPSIRITDTDGKNGFNMGRTYTRNIAMEAPLVHFVPGTASYSSDFSKSEKDVLNEYTKARQKGVEVSEAVIDRITGIEGRFFSFTPAYNEYIKYVNILCRNAAIYMGIGDKFVPGTETKYKNYNYLYWQDGRDGAEKSIFNIDLDEDPTYGDGGLLSSVGGIISTGVDVAKGLLKNIVEKGGNLAEDVVSGYTSVKMYVDAGSSFSESISNSTSESQIAGLFEQGESIMKEVQFWGGSSLLTNLQDLAGGLVEAVGGLADGLMSALGMGGSQLNNLDNYAYYIVKGSNIVFPEIWNDGSYSKSYSFTVNLVSPYGTPESIFLHCIMPLMFIMALSLPRQTSANSYTSPFFVRVMSKGWFSCDMGIVDSIGIEKGSEGWTVNGLPTSIKVSISVKDLHSTLSIPKSSQPALFFNNNALIEFLAATCGVDTMIPNLALKAETLLHTVGNVVTDIPSNMYQGFSQRLNNTVMNLTKLF